MDRGPRRQGICGYWRNSKHEHPYSSRKELIMSKLLKILGVIISSAWILTTGFVLVMVMIIVGIYMVYFERKPE